MSKHWHLLWQRSRYAFHRHPQCIFTASFTLATGTHMSKLRPWPRWWPSPLVIAGISRWLPMLGKPTVLSQGKPPEGVIRTRRLCRHTSLSRTSWEISYLHRTKLLLDWVRMYVVSNMKWQNYKWILLLNLKCNPSCKSSQSQQRPYTCMIFGIFVSCHNDFVLANSVLVQIMMQLLNSCLHLGLFKTLDVTQLCNQLVHLSKCDFKI